MDRPRPFLVFLAGLSLLCTAAHADTPGVSNERISASISKAVRWLYTQENQWGTWEHDQQPTGIQRDLADQGQFGELTSMALQALLSSGENDRDPRLVNAIDFISNNDRIVGTCAIGLRAQVWPLLTTSPAVRKEMARDRNTLLAAIHDRGTTKGLFSFRTDYENEPDYADHDVSFHAVLGLRALADAGIEMPDTIWTNMQRAWRNQQAADGSWTYRPRAAGESPKSLNMTANGVAVLLTVDDELAASRPADCQPIRPDPYIDMGLNWIDDHFDHLRDPFDFGGFTLLNYGLYSISRIGQISGRMFFNQRDWYQEGARVLLDAQDDSGSWGNLPDTCFALIFLARSRNPVILSKLEYNAMAPPPVAGRAGRPNGPRVGNSDLRPRDVANFAGWIGRESEQPFNWEDMNLVIAPEYLHDSSILYVAGNQPMNLSKEDKAKLKLFMEQGGMLFGNADCGAKPFSDSFRKLGSELFPNYEFRNVPRDSVILNNEQYRASNWPQIPAMVELNNGVRDLMILIPDADPSRFFQQRQVGGRRFLYELMADVVYYSIDQSGARLKGDSYLVRPNPAVPTLRTVKLARLSYNGNWDPEPGGWPRMAAIEHNTHGIDLQVAPVRLGDGKLDGYKVAHLTGTTAFQLNEAARTELRRFVQRGGTLIVDSAGGSSAFDTAAQNQLTSAFPDMVLDAVPDDHPAFRTGQTWMRPAYRRYARTRLDQTSRFLLKSARFGSGTVYYSAEDLSAGLVGEPVDGIYGYQPQIASTLMGNLIAISVK